MKSSERKEIIRKLKVVARHKHTFYIADCWRDKLHKYFCKHMTDDWVECAGILVAKGELYKVGHHKYSTEKQ